MGVKNVSKGVVFKTFEEYQQFYAVPAKDRLSKGSLYYRVGESIAKLACDNAVKKTPCDRAGRE
jgi:hypothetical protein